jgi:transcriptional regulator with XRE-family HTH domain
MKNNFPDAFKVALKYSEMTQEDLEEKSGVSRQTISLYSNRDTNITKEKLMRLCIGMSLPYEISIALFDISPCPLRNTAQDLTYKLILETETMRSVEECNELLSKLGEKAL